MTTNTPSQTPQPPKNGIEGAENDVMNESKHHITTLAELRKALPKGWKVGVRPGNARWYWAVWAEYSPDTPPWPEVCVTVRVSVARTRKEAVTALSSKLEEMGVLK